MVLMILMPLQAMRILLSQVELRVVLSTVPFLEELPIVTRLEAVESW